MNWRDFQALQRVAELGDRFISYVDEGRGEPVVLLHGIPTWGFVWCGLVPALALTHRALAPDLLGFGFSDKREGFDRSIEHQAEMLDAWMEHLGLERATLVGHDLGGGVALQLATRFPRRVGRLCLIDGVCYDAWPIEPMLQLGHPGVDRKLSPTALRRMLKPLLAQGFAHQPSPELLEGLLAPYVTNVGKRSLLRDAAALDTNQTLELEPELLRLKVPTLILWGEDDRFLPIRYGERLAWDIPGAHLFRIHDARHFVMFDQPHEVATRLLHFLEGRSLTLYPADAPPG